MKYRSRAEIVSQILRAANGGTGKTRIMYAAYISYSQTMEYLDFLVRRKLLTYDKQSGRYKPTDRGLRFLSLYDELGELIEIDNEAAMERLKSIASLHRMA